MRGLHIDGGALRFRKDLPEPEPGPGEVLIEVLQVGICATDLALLRGYMGFRGTPGHEFVGRALGGRFAGQRVVGEINAACGRCGTCEAGLARHCPHRSVLGILGRPGAFAARIALPEDNLLAVPAGVSTDAATFTEPLAAAFEILEQCRIRETLRALVAGDGRLGLLCAQVLALAGAEVTLAGRHPERAALLPERVRHRTGLLESDGSPPSERFDLAVEATGNPGVLQRLLPWVRPRGTLVLKTTSEAAAPLDLAPVVVDEITIVGSRCGRFAPALEALSAGKVEVEGMISARYPLEAADVAFAHAAAAESLKVLVAVAGPQDSGLIGPEAPPPNRSGY
jgi:threonine dehydrogenase-like Zn-dependent dehydrogenase